MSVKYVKNKYKIYQKKSHQPFLAACPKRKYVTWTEEEDIFENFAPNEKQVKLQR